VNLEFASATYGSPTYFVPSNFKNPSPSPDYRAGGVHELMNKAIKHLQRTTKSNTLDPRLAQFVSLGFAEPLSASARTAEYKIQLSEIERLKSAPANWSMSAVETPSEEQTNVARKALLSMLVSSVSAPQVMVLDDGTFGAYWRKAGLYASIDFDIDGEFPWTIVNKDDVKSGIWRQSQPIPEELKAAVYA